jgi:hypothetical protein
VGQLVRLVDADLVVADEEVVVHGEQRVTHRSRPSFVSNP